MSLSPPAYSEESYPTVLENGWRMHTGAKWMYNLVDVQFLHIPSNKVYASDSKSSAHAEGDIPAAKRSKFQGSIESSAVAADTFPAIDTLSVDSDDVDIDLFKDLLVVTSQSRGLKEGACEDRIIDKFKIPLDYMGSSASCVMFACLDGHGGSACVDYVVKQLPVSILSVIRNPMKRKANDSDNLQNVFKKAFQVTDNNFLHMAKRIDEKSGTTIVLATLVGPDPQDGQLRLLLGSLGDSRAVLYRKINDTEVVPVATNITHRPSNPSEVKRIVAEGGQVGKVQGIDRVIKKLRNNTIGLSVSRAMGNYLLKDPKPVVSAVPEFTETVIDLDTDLFIVLGTDGVFDYISDEEIGNMIAPARQQSVKAMQRAADEIVALAKTRGSVDDRTCVILDFTWTASRTEEELEEPTQVCEDDDDIFEI